MKYQSAWENAWGISPDLGVLISAESERDVIISLPSYHKQKLLMKINMFEVIICIWSYEHQSFSHDKLST